MSQTYEIMVSGNGTLTTLGEIEFDEDNNSTLTLEANDAQGDALKKVWDEISGYPDVDFEKTTRVQQDDGSWLRVMSFERVGKDSPDYPAVAMQFLQIHHGYRFALRPKVEAD